MIDRGYKIRGLFIAMDGCIEYNYMTCCASYADKY